MGVVKIKYLNLLDHRLLNRLNHSCRDGYARHLYNGMQWNGLWALEVCGGNMCTDHQHFAVLESQLYSMGSDRLDEDAICFVLSTAKLTRSRSSNK